MSKPDKTANESTAWYASFWKFRSTYLDDKMGEAWCLSPEQSLSLHAENWTVPGQQLVRAPAALVAAACDDLPLGAKA